MQKKESKRRRAYGTLQQTLNDMAARVFKDLITRSPNHFFYSKEMSDACSDETNAELKECADRSMFGFYDVVIRMKEKGLIVPVQTPPAIAATLKGGAKQRIYYTFADPRDILIWKSYREKQI